MKIIFNKRNSLFPRKFFMTVFNCIFINKVNKNKDKPELKAKSTYFDNCMQKLFVVNDDLNKTNDTFDFQCYQKICNQILISVTHCSFLWWECDTSYITFPLFHSLVRVGLFRLASTSDIQIRIEDPVKHLWWSYFVKKMSD